MLTLPNHRHNVLLKKAHIWSLLKLTYRSLDSNYLTPQLIPPNHRLFCYINHLDFGDIIFFVQHESLICLPSFFSIITLFSSKGSITLAKLE